MHHKARRVTALSGMVRSSRAAYCAAGTDAAVPVCRIAARMQLYRQLRHAVGAQRNGHHCLLCPFPNARSPAGPSPCGGSASGRAAGPAAPPESSAGSPAMYPRLLPAGRSHYPSPSAARSFRAARKSATLCRPHCRLARHSKADAGTAVLHHCGRHDPAGCPAAIVQRQFPPQAAPAISACAATCCSSWHRSKRTRAAGLHSVRRKSSGDITSFTVRSAPLPPQLSMFTACQGLLVGTHMRRCWPDIRNCVDQTQCMEACLFRILLRDSLRGQCPPRSAASAPYPCASCVLCSVVLLTRR